MMNAEQRGAESGDAAMVNRRTEKGNRVSLTRIKNLILKRGDNEDDSQQTTMSFSYAPSQAENPVYNK